MEKKNNSNLIFWTMLAGLLLARIIGTLIIPVYDDAFITYRYAENFARGFGLVYNQNEFVLGLTTPLFGIIAGVLSFIGLKLPHAIVALSIVLDSATLFLIFGIFKKKGLMLEFVLLGFLFAVSPIMTRVSVGGMEMSLFLFLSLLVIHFYTNDKKNLAVVTATISYFVRPEAALLVIFLIIYEFFGNSKKNSLKMILISLLVLAVPFFLMIRYYGNFIPQSVIAKSDVVHFNLTGMLKEFLAADIICLFSLPLAIYGFYKFYNKDKFFQILGIWSIVFFLIYLVAHPQVWSWYPHTFRFTIFIFASFSLSRILKNYENEKRRLNIFVISQILVSMICMVWVFFMFSFGRSPVTVHVYKPIEYWCENEKISDKKILASDIGAIGYYSNAYIFDSEGLVSPEAKQYKQFDKMILNVNPDYLFLIVNKENIKMIRNKEMSVKYYPLKRFAKSGSQDLYPDPEKLKENWIQDYIIYKRYGK